MRYVSTRGSAPDLGFDDVLLTGLARDGGLYVPAEWPQFDAAKWRSLAGLDYVDLAVEVLEPFVTPALDRATLHSIAADTYAGFRHTAVAPLKQLSQNDWLMELFHGPTFAFKDYALQLLGRLFDHVLAKRGQRITVVGATSGDTGSAAMEACRDRAAVDVFIMFPHGRVSEVQRRQMTTIEAANIHALAIEGTFDDAQDIVKALFNDLPFRDKAQLAAVNSINWARIMAQIVYYAAAALALGAPDRKVAFAVPTGNFGNVYAAYAAKRMGLPIERLVIGTNRNDILARSFATGEMSIGTVEPSLSPSMDIQVSSNFERLLFELMQRDGKALTASMASFRETGRLVLPANGMGEARELFAAIAVDDEATLSTIAHIAKSTGEIIDPHTAVGVAAAGWQRASEALPADMPLVALACAHPAKFAPAVEKAIGRPFPLPETIERMMTAPERVTVLPATAEAVRAHIEKTLGLSSGRETAA